jgi:hypothetical protein
MQALVGKELDYVWTDPGREAVVFESSACRLEEMQALVGKELYYSCTCGRTQVAKPRSLDAAFEDVVMVAAGGRAIRPWLRIFGTLYEGPRTTYLTRWLEVVNGCTARG